MKILIVNTTDIQGGAGRAAYRLHKSLLEAGINTQMLVQKKTSDDYNVISLANNKIQEGVNLLRPTLDTLPTKFYKNRKKILFSPAWLNFNNLVSKIEEINPDIVHLHWICGGMIKIEELAKIKKPIVWSLHDNWAFTGGCHIKLDCDKYKSQCGLCPILGSSKERDLSRWVWKRKKKTFDNMQNLTIIGLSRWIMNLSKESSLLKNKKHINLPNPIDTSLYKPFDKYKARELWNLPKDKKLILFGAINPLGNVVKGFKELSEALKLLDLENVEFVVFGGNKPKNPVDFKFKTNYVGRLYDDISLVTLYSAVDVMIVPSLQENLSNSIMESLSCATPVVAFNIGGNSDMIEHKKNGYLAKPFDVRDLANGIEWVLNLDENQYNKLAQNAREKVLNEFDSKVVAKKYINLYESILKRQLINE